MTVLGDGTVHQRLGTSGCVGESERVRVTAAALVRCLECEPFRTRWTAEVKRQRGTGVHQGAVAQVLADYLWDTGQVDEADHDLPRRLKDAVSRALRGLALPPGLLRQFIAAFGFPPAVAQELWRLRSGGEGQLDLLSPAVFPPAAATAVPQYRTLALWERHLIGQDGLPQSNETIQVIEALAPMTHYVYRFDTAAVAIQMRRGGSVGDLGQSEIPGLSQVLLELDEPLAAGDVTTLEYSTLFAYSDPPPKEFRRAARRRINAVTLSLGFHPDAVPEHIWFASWASLDASAPERRTEVNLRTDGSVSRFVDHVESGIVGFYWT